jgi:integrase
MVLEIYEIQNIQSARKYLSRTAEPVILSNPQGSTRYYETERLVEFGSYLVVEGLVDKNPFSLEKISKATKEPFPWFTISDVEQILLQARKSDAEVYEVLAFTGMRIGEIRRLQWSHIDFNRGVLTVVSTSLNPTKGKYSRVIPMHARVIKVLNGLKSKTGLVFNADVCHQFPEGNRPIYKNGLLDRLKVICKNLNVEGCLHSFRKFFCSYMANQGVPVLTLKEWTGHKDIKVLIDSYYKLHEEDSVNFMKKVSGN